MYAFDVIWPASHILYTSVDTSLFVVVANSKFKAPHQARMPIKGRNSRYALFVCCGSDFPLCKAVISLHYSLVGCRFVFSWLRALRYLLHQPFYTPKKVLAAQKLVHWNSHTAAFLSVQNNNKATSSQVVAIASEKRSNDRATKFLSPTRIVTTSRSQTAN